MIAEALRGPPPMRPVAPTEAAVGDVTPMMRNDLSPSTGTFTTRASLDGVDGTIKVADPATGVGATSPDGGT